jgi:hypothetical protein
VGREEALVTRLVSHKLQPLDVSVNSALKAKTKAIFYLEHGKLIGECISNTRGEKAHHEMTGCH